MAAKVIKRQIKNGNIPKKSLEVAETSDALAQLLRNYDHGESEVLVEKRKLDCCCYWMYVLSNAITQWARKIAHIFTGIGSCLKRHFLNLFLSHGLKEDKKMLTFLNALQEERLRNLRYRFEVPFDSSLIAHQEALRKLWQLSYPNVEIPPSKSDMWKEMGWQGTDPSTDFRGGGFISLENLIYFAENYPDSFQRLLHKKDGPRSEWEYPFAAAGVNISYMLMHMLDLQSAKPISRIGYHFIRMLEEDAMAFDELYCVAFETMDAQWLAGRATYMQFNEVMKSTRTMLEQELGMDGITRIQDLPLYKLLSR